MSSQLPWHVARAGGIVAWALVASSVIWGLALSTRVLGRRPRPAWLFDLHRFLGGLAVVFTVVHVLAVVADSYVDFGLVNVLVPLTGDWHPLAVAWGIVGLYLLLAVELTSLAMSRLPRRLWRRVHMTSFLVFATTSVHALTAGTDRRSAPFLVAVVLACGVVALLTAVRDGRLHARPSFWQLTQTRKARARGEPAHLVVHEDLLVFVHPPGLSGLVCKFVRRQDRCSDQALGSAR